MGLIYHYTNQTGLTGIIPMDAENIKLWFTRADCLNDSQEGSDIKKVYIRVIRKMKKNKTISVEQFNTLKQVDFDYKAFFEFDSKLLKVQNVLADTFICSFSYDSDSLDMWRYYSKGSFGCTIEFSQALMQKEMRHDPDNDSTFPLCDVNWYTVIYSNEEKEGIIENIIMDYIKLFPGQNEDDLKNLSIAVQNELRKYQYSFKNECFATEKEIRCVITQPKEDIEGFRSKRLPIKYRIGYDRLIPYVEWDFNPSMVRDITVSPFAPKNAVKVLKEYLRNEKYSKLRDRISKSKLPVKF